MEITSILNAHLDHSSVVSSVFTERENTFLTANKDGTLTYVTYSPKFRQKSYKIASKQFSSMAYSNDINKIVLGTSDGDIYIISKKFEVLSVLKHKHTDRIIKIEFTDKCKYFITASYDGSLKIFNSINFKYVSSLYGHQGHITDFAISPDEGKIMTACSDKKLRIFDLKSRKCVALIGPFRYVPTTVRFHSNGKYYFAGFLNGTIACFKTKSSKKIMSYKAHQAAVSCFDVHNSGIFIVSVSVDSTITVFEVEGGKILLTMLVKQKGLSTVRFSVDGSLLMTTSVNGRNTIWDFPFNKLLKNTISENEIEEESNTPENIYDENSFPEVTPSLTDMKAQTVPVPVALPVAQVSMLQYGYTQDPLGAIYMPAAPIQQNLIQQNLIQQNLIQQNEPNTQINEQGMSMPLKQQGRICSLSKLGPNPYDFSESDSFKSVDAQEVEVDLVINEPQTEKKSGQLNQSMKNEEEDFTQNIDENIEESISEDLENNIDEKLQKFFEEESIDAEGDCIEENFKENIEEILEEESIDDNIEENLEEESINDKIEENLEEESINDKIEENLEEESINDKIEESLEEESIDDHIDKKLEEESTNENIQENNVDKEMRTLEEEEVFEDGDTANKNANNDKEPAYNLEDSINSSPDNNEVQKMDEEEEELNDMISGTYQTDYMEDGKSSSNIITNDKEESILKTSDAFKNEIEIIPTEEEEENVERDNFDNDMQTLDVDQQNSSQVEDFNKNMISDSLHESSNTTEDFNLDLIEEEEEDMKDNLMISTQPVHSSNEVITLVSVQTQPVLAPNALNDDSEIPTRESAGNIDTENDNIAPTLESDDQSQE